MAQPPPFVIWISLGISVLSLLTAVIVGWKGHSRRKYDVVDAILNDLLKISLQYPELRDPEHCQKAFLSADKAVKYRYDAYATLVWNYLETLYESYGAGLEKTSFYPSLRHLGERHKAWFFANDKFKSYNKRLVDFLGVQR